MKTKIQAIGERYKSSFSKRLHSLETGMINRQRLTVFYYTSILLILGVFLNLCGVAGPNSPFFKIANLTQGALAALGIYLYYSHRISITTAMSLLCIVMQVELSAETIHSTIHQTPFNMALIIANMALSAVVLLLGIITYLRIVPYVVALLSLSTYAMSVYATGSDVLASFFLVFFIVFIVFSVLGSVIILNMTRLDKENSQLKIESQEILDAFHLTQAEMYSYMKLARDKRLETEQIAGIMDAIGGAAEKRILDNVAHYIRQTEIEYDKLRERLPELTRSELEICELILKEKKQKEIIDLLGKTRGNITSQRTNIRAKLNMQPGDNLYEVLKKRMEG